MNNDFGVIEDQRELSHASKSDLYLVAISFVENDDVNLSESDDLPDLWNTSDTESKISETWDSDLSQYVIHQIPI